MKFIKDLKETTQLMESDDYKDRFIAEYLQLKIRYVKLSVMINRWDNGRLNFEPTCPRIIYDTQLEAMLKYINVLEERARIEKISLPFVIVSTEAY